MMKYICITCKGRETYVDYLSERIEGLIVSFDDFTDTGKFNSTAFFNHQRAWGMAGNEPSVVMEDDILLCDGFLQKIETAISERPNDVIQFFSMRGKDLTVGSRYENGGNFMMCQCFYLPAGYGQRLHDFSKAFYETTNDKTCPSDPCIAAFLKTNKLKYYIHVPNLVDHRISKSMLGARSSKRQSKTFHLA